MYECFILFFWNSALVFALDFLSYIYENVHF